MLLGRGLGIIWRSSRHGGRVCRKRGGECFTMPTVRVKETKAGRIVSDEHELSRYVTAGHAREARLVLRIVQAKLSRVRPVVALALLGAQES